MKTFFITLLMVSSSSSFAGDYVYTKEVSVLAPTCERALSLIKTSLDNAANELLENATSGTPHEIVSKEISDKCFVDQHGNYQMDGTLKYTNPND